MAIDHVDRTVVNHEATPAVTQEPAASQQTERRAP